MNTYKIYNDTEIYLQRHEIEYAAETLRDLVNILKDETCALTDKMSNCQLVIMLNHDKADGHDWKMFIYFDKKVGKFYYSFQDEDYNDTDLFMYSDLDEIYDKIEEEVNNVRGFKWVALDADEGFQTLNKEN